MTTLCNGGAPKISVLAYETNFCRERCHYLMTCPHRSLRGNVGAKTATQLQHERDEHHANLFRPLDTFERRIHNMVSRKLPVHELAVCQQLGVECLGPETSCKNLGQKLVALN